MKTVIQIDEVDFRNVGKHGDILISTLRECEELIKNGIMTIRTNTKFDLHIPEILAFNRYLQIMKNRNIISIQIVLD